MQYEVIDIKTVSSSGETQGKLSFFEAERDIPFQIRRVYWIYGADVGTERGFHAHKDNYQFIFCPIGSIDIILNDGSETETVCLNEPSKGLVLWPGLWRRMVWREKNSVLCVAASDYYCEEDYIRNYDEYRKYIEDKKSGRGVAYALDLPKIMNREQYSVQINAEHDIPFGIKRVFYIYGEKENQAVRGKHANRESEFVLVCVSGQCRVKVIGVNQEQRIYDLNRPDAALYLPKMTWKEMYGFSLDCVLLALTSEYYSSEEYIRDFDLFRAEMRGRES